MMSRDDQDIQGPEMWHDFLTRVQNYYFSIYLFFLLFQKTGDHGLVSSDAKL